MKSKLLLHACCPKASAPYIEDLSKEFDITMLFFNPNIDQHYRETISDELESIALSHSITYIKIDDKKPKILCKGQEYCMECLSFRISRAFEYAIDNEFEMVATTLTVSPGKPVDLLNQIGVDLAQLYGIRFLKINEVDIPPVDVPACSCSKIGALHYEVIS